MNNKTTYIIFFLSLIIIPINVYADNLSNGLQHYFTFDQASNFTDVTGKANGTLSGTSYNVAGCIQGTNCYKFNGSALSYLNFNLAQWGHSGYDSGYTYSMWMKFNATPGYDSAIFIGFDYFSLRTTNLDRIMMYDYDGVNNPQVYPSLVTNFSQWYHVMAVYNGTNVTVYIDNVPTYGGKLTSVSTYSGQHYIGGDAANSRIYGPTIDEVGVWNRALNSSERASLYNGGLGWTYTNFTAEPAPPVVEGCTNCRYWVNGSGNWSDTSHWSNTSGGTGGFSIPNSTTNCIFDNNSASNNYSVSPDIGLTSAGTCLDFNWSLPSSGVPTLASGGRNIDVYGNLYYPSGMIVSPTSNSLYFKGTNKINNITTNNVNFWRRIYFDGVNTTFRLQDNLTTSALVNTMSLTNGVFDANNKTVFLIGTNPVIASSFTFYNLVINTTATTTDSLTLSANQVVTGVLNLTGNSATNRLLIKSDTLGTARTISAGSVVASNVDFQDIKFNTSTDLSAITGFSGDCGGNSNITFTPAQTNYWVGGTGSWSTVGEWANTSGGTASTGRVSLCQDSAVFDGNSFSTTGLTVTQDMPRIGSVNWTNQTKTPTFTTSTTASVFGHLILDPNITLTGSGVIYTFSGRNIFYIDGINQTIPLYIKIDSINGSLYLLNNLKTSNNYYVNVNSGGLYLNNYNLTTGSFLSSNSNTRIINISNSVLTFLDSGSNPWNTGTITGLTFDSSSSLILINMTQITDQTFNGGGLSFNNIYFTGLSNGYYYTISGSNVFNNFRVEPNRYIKFTTGTTQRVASWNVSGNSSNLIRLASTTTTNAIINFTGDVTGCNNVSSDYLNISDITVNPSGKWFAGTHSVNTSDAPGWVFTDPTCSGNSCVYSGSGNWDIVWSDNCSITTSYNLGKNNISIGNISTSGNTNFVNFTALPTNYSYLFIWSGGSFYSNKVGI